MSTPAWEHKRRVQREAAARAAAEAQQTRDAEKPDGEAADRERFALLLAELEENRKRISAYPSGSGERLALKRELLAYYQPMIAEYLAGGRAYQNDILVAAIIWSFDVGEIDEAMRLAAVALEQGQQMPERFKSSLRIFVADAVFDWARAEFAAGKPAAPYWEQQLQAVTAPETAPLYHSEIRIKYLKLAAAEAEKRGEPATALEYLEAAAAVDADKAQVKTARARLQKQLAQAAEAARHEM